MREQYRSGFATASRNCHTPNFSATIYFDVIHFLMFESAAKPMKTLDFKVIAVVVGFREISGSNDNDRQPTWLSIKPLRCRLGFAFGGVP